MWDHNASPALFFNLRRSSFILRSPLSPLPRYNAYSASYGDAMDTHSLTPAGVLSYFGSQMVGGKAGPDQTMNLPATAKVSYVSEL